ALHTPAAGVRLVLAQHHAPALLVPLVHVARFEVVCEQHVRIIRDANVAGVLRSDAPYFSPALSLPSGAGEGDRFGAIREIGPSFFHWITSLEFGEPFLRAAINPRGGILFAQALEGRNRFIVSDAANKTVCPLDLIFAHGQRAGHDASGFLLREVDAHL